MGFWCMVHRANVPQFTICHHVPWGRIGGKLAVWLVNVFSSSTQAVLEQFNPTFAVALVRPLGANRRFDRALPFVDSGSSKKSRGEGQASTHVSRGSGHLSRCLRLIRDIGIIVIGRQYATCRRRGMYGWFIGLSSHRKVLASVIIVSALQISQICFFALRAGNKPSPHPSHLQASIRPCCDRLPQQSRDSQLVALILNLISPTASSCRIGVVEKRSRRRQHSSERLQLPTSGSFSLLAQRHRRREEQGPTDRRTREDGTKRELTGESEPRSCPHAAPMLFCVLLHAF